MLRFNYTCIVSHLAPCFMYQVAPNNVEFRKVTQQKIFTEAN